MIYFVVFFSLAFLVLLSTRVSDKKKLVIDIIATVILVLFQGLRWERGTDWDTNYDIFRYAAEPPFYYEYGWWFLNHYINEFTGSYTIRLILESLITCCLYLSFAKYIGVKNRSFFILSLYCGCVFPVRFELASALVLNGFRFIIERDFKKFLLIIIIASTIHIAAFLFIPFYFVPRKEFSLQQMLLIYIISILIGFLSESVLSVLEGFNNLLSIGGVDDNLQDKVDGYLEGGIPDFQRRSVLSHLLSFANGAFFILLYNYFRRLLFHERRNCNSIEAKKKNGIKSILLNRNAYNILLNLYLFGICLNRIVSLTVPYLARIGILACAGGGFLIVLGIENGLKKQVTTFMFIYICYRFIALLGILYGQYSNLYFPYMTII